MKDDRIRPRLLSQNQPMSRSDMSSEHARRATDSGSHCWWGTGRRSDEVWRPQFGRQCREPSALRMNAPLCVPTNMRTWLIACPRLVTP